MKEQSLTDETKAIMLQLEQLKNRRVELTNELTSVDDQIDELQRMLISERKRTSSVSDNIRVFEGLAEPQRNLVSRSQSMIPSPKHPSSYTHLWHLSEKNGDDEVVIPDDLVMIQPNRTLPSSIKMSGKASNYKLYESSKIIVSDVSKRCFYIFLALSFASRFFL
jgi:hypothetical protein